MQQEKCHLKEIFIGNNQGLVSLWNQSINTLSCSCTQLNIVGQLTNKELNNDVWLYNTAHSNLPVIKYFVRIREKKEKMLNKTEIFFICLRPEPECQVRKNLSFCCNNIKKSLKWDLAWVKTEFDLDSEKKMREYKWRRIK